MCRTILVSGYLTNLDGDLTCCAVKPRWSINIFDEPEEKEAPNGVVV